VLCELFTTFPIKVHVEFNSDLDKIILEGPPDQVRQAKEAFETFTDDLVCVCVCVCVCAVQCERGRGE